MLKGWLKKEAVVKVHILVEMPNIGIVGKLGSGKTSLANYLYKEMLYRKESFADPMKRIAKEFFGFEKGDPEYRGFMQKLGTDWFRSVDENVWVNHLFQRTAGVTRLVVDDVRFPNEAEGLLEAGWKLIYLDCDEKIRIDRVIERDGTFDPSCLDHPSEVGVDEIVRLYGSDLHYVDAEVSADEVNDYIRRLLVYKILS